MATLNRGILRRVAPQNDRECPERHINYETILCKLIDLCKPKGKLHMVVMTMKRIISFLLVFILLLAPSSIAYAGLYDDYIKELREKENAQMAENVPTGPFSDDPKAIQAAADAVVMLSCYDQDGVLYATGSAFAAFEDGVFVTNYHVIEGEVYSIRAQMESGLEFRISSVVAYDADRDIAILRTNVRTGLSPLPLGDSSALERGEKVIAIGSPLGLINTLSIGLFSGTVRDDRVYLQFSAPISQGSSGGALFNNSGEVIGITSASYTAGQNLNLAIPINDAKAVYAAAATETEMSVAEFYEKNAVVVEIEEEPDNTPEYYYEHRAEFVGQELTIEGYISSIANFGQGNIDLHLISDPEKISKSNIQDVINHRPSIDLTEISSWFLEVGMYISIQCKVVNDSYIHFIATGVEILQ